MFDHFLISGGYFIFTSCTYVFLPHDKKNEFCKNNCKLLKSNVFEICKTFRITEIFIVETNSETIKIKLKLNINFLLTKRAPFSSLILDNDTAVCGCFNENWFSLSNISTIQPIHFLKWMHFMRYNVNNHIKLNCILC